MSAAVRSSSLTLSRFFSGPRVLGASCWGRNLLIGNPSSGAAVSLGLLHQKRTLSHLLVPKGSALLQPFQVRQSSSKPSLAELEQRVVSVCKAFDKISAEKLALDSHFINDLGLDSLDHVEVIMAMEDEFGFEIPDDHADKLLTPRKLVQYIGDHEDVYE